MTALARRIRERRKALGLSQEKLAEFVNVDQPQISRYEAGLNDISGEVLKAMSTALGVSSDWLLGLSDSTNISTEAELNALELAAVTALRSTRPARREIIVSIIRQIAALD